MDLYPPDFLGHSFPLAAILGLTKTPLEEGGGNASEQFKGGNKVSHPSPNQNALSQPNERQIIPEQSEAALKQESVKPHEMLETQIAEKIKAALTDHLGKTCESNTVPMKARFFPSLSKISIEREDIDGGTDDFDQEKLQTLQGQLRIVFTDKVQ
jgi:hypothetical protein